MRAMIEIRAGEGGDEAKLLVGEQARIYCAYAQRMGLDVEIEEERPGFLVLSVEGVDSAVQPLLGEAGGHRWQRVPETGNARKNGLVHTSTVTVAVFQLLDERRQQIKSSDIKIFTTMDSGPGGQSRNKTESCVIMRHLPTGIEAKSAAKSQHRNRAVARAMLEARVALHYSQQRSASEAAERRAMVGSGMRGDKIRTYRVRDDRVTDHRSGCKMRLTDVLAGRLPA